MTKQKELDEAVFGDRRTAWGWAEVDGKKFFYIDQNNVSDGGNSQTILIPSEHLAKIIYDARYNN